MQGAVNFLSGVARTFWSEEEKIDTLQDLHARFVQISKALSLSNHPNEEQAAHTRRSDLNNLYNRTAKVVEKERNYKALILLGSIQGTYALHVTHPLLPREVVRTHLMAALNAFLEGIGVISAAYPAQDLAYPQAKLIVIDAILYCDKDSLAQAVQAAEMPLEYLLVLIKMCSFIARSGSEDNDFKLKCTEIVKAVAKHSNDPAVEETLNEFQATLDLEAYKQLKRSCPSDWHLLKLEIDHMKTRDDVEKITRFALNLIESKISTPIVESTLKVLLDDEKEGKTFQNCTNKILQEAPAYTALLIDLCLKSTGILAKNAEQARGAKFSKLMLNLATYSKGDPV